MKSVFLLVINMVKKAINFGIHKLRRLSTVGMLFLERLKMFPNRKSYQGKKNLRK